MSEFTLAPPDAPATPQAPATPSATPSVTPASATPGAPSAPVSGAVPEGYVPSYRLRETREALDRQYRAEVERVRAEQASEADKLRQQIRALTGVSTPNPQTAELDSIRQQFSQLYPGLAKMEERANDLFGLVDKAGDFETATAHHWESYGRDAMNRLYTKAGESLGGPLSEEGKRQLHVAFSGWVGSSPELSARYASDPSIVEDFWKQFTSNFVDPARRTAQSAVAGRANTPIPQDNLAGAPRVGAPPEQPKDLDGKARNAWAMFSELRNK